MQTNLNTRVMTLNSEGEPAEVSRVIRNYHAFKMVTGFNLTSTEPYTKRTQ